MPGDYNFTKNKKRIDAYFENIYNNNPWRRIEVVITGLTRNQLAGSSRLAGSNPAVSVKYYGALAQLGARHTGSVEATGSSPVCSTVKGEDLIQVFAFLQLTFSQSDRGSAVREERR